MGWGRERVEGGGKGECSSSDKSVCIPQRGGARGGGGVSGRGGGGRGEGGGQKEEKGEEEEKEGKRGGGGCRSHFLSSTADTIRCTLNTTQHR